MNPERPPSPEAAILSHYNHLLVADPRQYSLGRDDGNYIRIKKPFTPSVRDELLRGRLSVALFCLTPEGLAIQGIVDVDKADGNKELQSVALALRDLGLQPLLEASRRGGHVRIFHEPVAPEVGVSLLKSVLTRLDIEAEVFPKGTGLSSIRAPLSRHPITKKQYPFLDVDTLEPVARDRAGNLRHLSTFRRATHRELAEALAKAIEPPRKRPTQSEGYIAQGMNSIKPDIMEVISAELKVSKVGKHFRAVCPFHADKTPSLVIYPDTQTFHCFGAGCGAHGDVIRFLALRQGVRDGDILRQLRG